MGLRALNWTKNTRSTFGLCTGRTSVPAFHKSLATSSKISRHMQGSGSNAAHRTSTVLLRTSLDKDLRAFVQFVCLILSRFCLLTFMHTARVHCITYTGAHALFDMYSQFHLYIYTNIYTSVNLTCQHMHVMK